MVERIAAFSYDRFDVEEIKDHVTRQLRGFTLHLDTIIVSVKWFTGAVFENHEMRRCKIKVLLYLVTIDLAQKEFQEFTALPYQSICLFSKNNGVWYREADLMSFERPVDTLLQSSLVSI